MGTLFVTGRKCIECRPRNSTAYKQECPYEDKLGFVFEDEFSADWPFLGQTKV